MKMNTKKKKIMCIGTVIVMFMSFIPVSATALINSDKEDITEKRLVNENPYLESGKNNLKLGDIVTMHNTKDIKKSRSTEVLFAEGKTVEISVDDMQYKIAKAEIAKIENPVEYSFHEVAKQKILLQAAQDKGYSVEQKELDNEISVMKQAILQAVNYNDFSDMLESFGGTNQYFEATQDELRDRMVIDKYILECRTAYFVQNRLDENSEDAQESWLTYYHTMIENLIRTQQFEVVIR